MSAAVIIIPQFAEMFGPWEIFLILTIILLLYGAKHLPEFVRELGRAIGKDIGGAFGRPIADALTHSNQTAEDTSQPAIELKPGMRKPVDSFIVWLAQGFGIGRIPFAPGTWGSLVGVGFYLLLVATDEPWLMLIAPVVAVPAAIWICGRAAQILRDGDPPSVVLDEIVAVPFCMMGILVFFNDWLGLAKTLAFWLGLCEPTQSSGPAISSGHGPLPPIPFAALFFRECCSPVLLGIVFLHFLLFRLFDIWKPWPIRQSQRLPGGWGIVIDDVLAAIYVNLVMLGAWFAFGR